MTVSPPQRPYLPLLLSGLLAASAAGAQEATPRFAEPQSRQPYGDWLLECFTRPDKTEACQLYQRMIVNQGQAIAMVTTFAADGETGKLRAQIALPLGIDLSRGARFVVDQGDEYYFPISRCTFQGCLLESLVPDELTGHMRRGTNASIMVVSPGQGDFTIPLSLNGFAAAYDKIMAPAATASSATPPPDRQTTGSTSTPSPPSGPATGR
ncbi:invasion associated locus B family protein [Nitratireductor pacificus]|uniref:invasion associated locus B family protein n=1 Tax=Nitratireductor pacificus TaxID=1231180 RepID=UPI0009DAE44C|nr:invasion associated locus B family protein [Nitratireductor pacificus]